MERKNHQRPPFRAEHLGSLLRPKDISEYRVKLDDKKALDILSNKELKEIEDKAIAEIVKLQIDLGFHAVNDGEYRRHQFWGTFFPSLQGFEEIMNPPLEMFRLYVPDIAAFRKSWDSGVGRRPRPILSSRLLTPRPPFSREQPQARRKHRLHGQDQARRQRLSA